MSVLRWSGVESFAIRYWTWEPVEIYESARKHGISDEDILHAVNHALVVADEDGTSRILYLGPDGAGNLLVIVSVTRDDETEILIHAMRMRRIYEPLLLEMGETDE